MGTKQIRLSETAQIKARLPEFIGRNVTLILTDGTSLVGRLEKVDATNVTLKNMRLKNVSCKLNSIAEIYFDTIA